MMNDIHYPNLSCSDLKFSPDTFTPKEFCSYFKYRLPIVVRFREVLNSNDGSPPKEELLLIKKFEEQRRILARDTNNRVISIPFDFPVRFCQIDVDKGITKDAKTLKHIFKKNKVPIHGYFDRKYGSTLKIDGKILNIEQFGKMKLIRVYLEKFMKGNYIKNGELDKNITLTPGNANIKITVPMSFVPRKAINMDHWQLLQAKWKQASWKLNYDSTAGMEGIMIFTLDKNFDVSVFGSEDYRLLDSYHAEKSVHQLTTQMSMMHTANGKTNGHYDADDVFIKPTTTEEIENGTNSQREQVIHTAQTQQKERSLSNQVFSPRPEESHHNTAEKTAFNFKMDGNVSSTQSQFGSIQRHHQEPEATQLVIKNPYRNSSIERHTKHLNYYNNVDIQTRNQNVPRSISDIVSPEAANVAQEHEYLLRQFDQKKQQETQMIRQQHANIYHTQAIHSSTLPRGGHGTTIHVEPPANYYTLPNRPHTHHANPTRYTHAYVGSPPGYSTIPRDPNRQNMKKMIYDQAFKQGYETAVLEQPITPIYAANGLQMGIQGGRYANSLPRSGVQYYTDINANNQIVLSSSPQPLSSPGSVMTFTTRPDENVVYEGELTLTKASNNKKRPHKIEQRAINREAEVNNYGFVENRHGKKQTPRHIATGVFSFENVEDQIEATTHDNGRNMYKQAKHAAKSNRATHHSAKTRTEKKRGNQSHWVTDKFIFDSDGATSDIQKQHDNISRVYSVTNDQNSEGENGPPYDETDLTTNDHPRRQHSRQEVVNVHDGQLNSSTGFKVTSMAQQSFTDQGQLQGGQGHYTRQQVVQVMNENFSTTTSLPQSNQINPNNQEEPLYTVVNKDKSIRSINTTTHSSQQQNFTRSIIPSEPQPPISFIQQQQQAIHSSGGFKITKSSSSSSSSSSSGADDDKIRSNHTSRDKIVSEIEPAYAVVTTNVYRKESDDKIRSNHTSRDKIISEIEPAYAVVTTNVYQKESDSTNSSQSSKSTITEINESLTNLDNILQKHESTSIRSRKDVNKFKQAARTETTVL